MEKEVYFSVCIPVYNRAHTIERTLDSLKKQSFKDFETILVDDGSTDNIKSVVDQWKNKNDFFIEYISKKNGGKHTAINRGLDVARGIFFLILDSDDWLKEDALQNAYMLCEKIREDETFSGIMGRCVNSENGKLIGDMFLEEPYISSYVDFHFKLSRKIKIGDCFECNKTEILKKYRFPEPKNTKFVPEAWLFDQIGVRYKLLCTNDEFEYKEYRNDGISKNSMYKYNNYIGFLYHYISRLENVIPYTKLPYTTEIIAWWRYWQMVKYDKENLGPRCKKITITGRLVKIMLPIISKIYEIKYNDLYKAGR